METDKIYNMDCLEGMKQIPDNSIDLVVTDPPYRAHFEEGRGEFGKRDYFKNVKEGVGHTDDFDIAPLLSMLIPKMKVFNAYFWCSQKQIYTYLDFAIKHNYHYEILIWNKTNPVPTKNNKYLPDTEHYIFIRDKGATFNNNLPFNFYRKVFRTPISQSQFGHPTEKPLKVILPSIAISSKEGDTILDPFMGSGTTAVACRMLNRHFIGFEISKEYCDIANNRLKKYMEQTNLTEVLNNGN